MINSNTEIDTLFSHEGRLSKIEALMEKNCEVQKETNRSIDRLSEKVGDMALMYQDQVVFNTKCTNVENRLDELERSLRVFTFITAHPKVSIASIVGIGVLVGSGALDIVMTIIRFI